MRSRIGKQEYSILNDLTAGDLFVGFLLSARSTKRMYSVAYKRAQARYRDKKALDRLEAKGFIKRKSLHNKDFIVLTKLGKSLAMQGVYTEKIRSKQNGKWDGRWRIITFDIPKTHHELRKTLRTVLFKVGFKKIQQSVYIYPYECDEMKDIIRYAQEEGEKFLFYVTASHISNEKYFLKLFGITQTKIR